MPQNRALRAATAIALVVPAMTLVACRTPEPETPAAGATADTLAGAAAPTGPATADTTGPVTLRTDRRQYAPGAPITLTLSNATDAQYAFNPCTRALQREADGAWRAVEEPGRVCTMEAWLLEPHASRSGGTELPASLEAGRYRVLLFLTREGTTPPAERVTAVSPPITVAR